LHLTFTHWGDNVFYGYGQLPFNSNDIRELEMLHCSIDPIPIHQLNSNADKKIEKIIHKLLSKKIEDRYLTSLSLLKDLNQIRPNGHHFYDAIKIDQLDATKRLLNPRNIIVFLLFSQQNLIVKINSN